MEVRFNDPKLFMGKNYQKMDAKTQILVEVLPSQVKRGSLETMISSVFEGFSYPMQAILIGNLLLGFT
jgi:hypothetical protein